MLLGPNLEVVGFVVIGRELLQLDHVRAFAHLLDDSQLSTSVLPVLYVVDDHRSLQARIFDFLHRPHLDAADFVVQQVFVQ